MESRHLLHINYFWDEAWGRRPGPFFPIAFHTRRDYIIRSVISAFGYRGNMILGQFLKLLPAISTAMIIKIFDFSPLFFTEVTKYRVFFGPSFFFSAPIRILMSLSSLVPLIIQIGISVPFFNLFLGSAFFLLPGFLCFLLRSQPTPSAFRYFSSCGTILFLVFGDPILGVINKFFAMFLIVICSIAFSTHAKMGSVLSSALGAANNFHNLIIVQRVENG